MMSHLQRHSETGESGTERFLHADSNDACSYVWENVRGTYGMVVDRYGRCVSVSDDAQLEMFGDKYVASDSARSGRGAWCALNECQKQRQLRHDHDGERRQPRLLFFGQYGTVSL